MTAIDHVRYAICRKCEFLNGLRICTKCNCFIPLKVKLPAAQCPVGKWSAIDQKFKI